MDRDEMLFCIFRFLQKADDKQLRDLLNFIRGFLRIDG